MIVGDGEKPVIGLTIQQEVILILLFFDCKIGLLFQFSGCRFFAI